MEKISLKFCLCSLQFKLLASVKMPRPGPGLRSKKPGPGSRAGDWKFAGAGWPGIENRPGPGPGRIFMAGYPANRGQGRGPGRSLSLSVPASGLRYHKSAKLHIYLKATDNKLPIHYLGSVYNESLYKCPITTNPVTVKFCRDLYNCISDA